MLLSFKGGVDAGNKSEFLSGSVIQELAAPKSLSVPIPSGCEAVVTAGSAVAVGQLIASAGDAFGACLSSPVSGTVTKVTGKIVIENDGLFTPFEEELDADDPYALLGRCGVTDSRGFSTAEKLSRQPSVFIISCVEDQPFFVNVQAILACMYDEFTDGINALKRLFPDARFLICVCDDSSELSKRFSETFFQDDNIQTLVVSSKYPQSDHDVLKKTVISGDTDSAEVIEAEELCCISRVFRQLRPVTSKLVTLGGDCAKRQEVFSVPYGSSAAALIMAGSGFRREPLKVIRGTAMEGEAIYSMKVPLDRTTQSVTLLYDHQHRYNAEASCIGCNRCVRVCPERLYPRCLVDAYRKNDTQALDRLGVSNCTLCGACSFICPARVNLLSLLKGAKLMGE